MTNAAECNSVLVAIGANLPGQMDSPKGQVVAAAAELAAHDLHIISQSHLYSTPCFPRGAGPDFVNAAVLCRTALSPEVALDRLHQIEDQMGRRRQTRWGARVIDMDLLGYGERVLPDRAGYEQWAGLDAAAQSSLAPDALILPHPRLHERAFVLVPLMDIAPDWVHPVLGQSVRQMHAALYPAELEEIHRLVD